MKVRGGAVPGHRGGGSCSRRERTLGGRLPGGRERGRGGEDPTRPDPPRQGPAAPLRCAPPCGSGRGALPALCVARAGPLRAEEKAREAARSICPVHPPPRRWDGGGAEPGRSGSLAACVRHPVVPLPQGRGQAGRGVAERAAGRSLAKAREKAGKLQPFMFKRDPSWPCLTCENVTHPESKRRSDRWGPVYWKGEGKMNFFYF